MLYIYPYKFTDLTGDRDGPSYVMYELPKYGRLENIHFNWINNPQLEVIRKGKLLYRGELEKLGNVETDEEDTVLWVIYLTKDVTDKSGCNRALLRCLFTSLKNP
jgi:hypothetical protein